MTDSSASLTPAQQATGKARFIRMTPRKMRLVIDVIRGKSVKDAEDLLKFIPKAASLPVSKVLKQAKNNATHNFSMLEDNLMVKTIFVDEGPTLKRIIPRARGRGDSLFKRTSHITIILEELADKPARRKAAK